MLNAPSVMDGALNHLCSLNGKKMKHRLQYALIVTGLGLYYLKLGVKKLWFNPETIRQALLRSGEVVEGSATVDAEKLEKKRNAERKLLEEGKGVCLYCGEEIWHNPTMVNAGYTWESEAMVGWCDKNKTTNKHAPKIITD